MNLILLFFYKEIHEKSNLLLLLLSLFICFTESCRITFLYVLQKPIVFLTVVLNIKVVLHCAKHVFLIISVKIISVVLFFVFFCYFLMFVAIQAKESLQRYLTIFDNVLRRFCWIGMCG